MNDIFNENELQKIIDKFKQIDLNKIMVDGHHTPGHSNDPAKDDSHEVKNEIFDRVGRPKFSKKIGHNPDIPAEEHFIPNLIVRANFAWESSSP